MLMLYLFCFIVGGGLLAFSVIGGHDHDPSGAGADHGPDHARRETAGPATSRCGPPSASRPFSGWAGWRRGGWASAGWRNWGLR